jgi:hypothetical protein
MTEAGQVLGLTAYYSRPLARGAQLRLQALVDGAVHLDGGLAPPDEAGIFRRSAQAIQTRRLVPNEPFAFRRGAALAVRASTGDAFGPPDGDVVVEVLVGLGTPGGGVA